MKYIYESSKKAPTDVEAFYIDTIGRLAWLPVLIAPT